MEADSATNDGRTKLPTDFAEHVAKISDLDTIPTTLEEWWTAVGDQYSANNLTVGLEDLYSPAPTRHEVQVNGRVRYANCAMDAIMAAIIEEQDTVTVRSIDPVAATPATITVSDDNVEVTPNDALICFGMDLDPANVEAVDSLAEWSVQDDKDEIRDSVCQYTNAFESEETYEQWDAVTDCVSAPLQPSEVARLLQEIPYDHC